MGVDILSNVSRMSRAVEDMESATKSDVNEITHMIKYWFQDDHHIQMSWTKLTKWNGFQPVAGTGEGDDAVDEGREEGAVAMLKEERAARSA